MTHLPLPAQAGTRDRVEIGAEETRRRRGDVERAQPLRAEGCCRVPAL
jgi:hypothetical protein